MGFGLPEAGAAPEVALLGHGDVSPHPCPIPAQVNQTLLGNPGLRVFGKVLDGFNEVLSRFVPNLSVWFDFSLCRISHHCKGAETRNCLNTKLGFFLQKQLLTWDLLTISIVTSPQHEINSSV